jgi:serine/threonine protein phosphatase PrpC
MVVGLCRPKPVHIKKRVSPGGLLVTRAFGDFHAKLPQRGGRAGTVIPDHGAISTLSAAAMAGGYIVLASDGIWDGLEASAVLDHIKGTGPTAVVGKQQVVPINPKPAVRTHRNSIGKLNGILDEPLTAAAERCVEAGVSSLFWKRAGK